MRDGIAASFSLIHDTVSQLSRRMAAEMKRYNYVTPVNFIELVVGYKEWALNKRNIVRHFQYFKARQYNCAPDINSMVFIAMFSVPLIKIKQ